MLVWGITQRLNPVSEPLSSLSGLWVEVPESTAVEISGGEVHTRPFEPQSP